MRPARPPGPARVVVAPKSESGSAQADPEFPAAVDEFLVRLVHPQKEAIQAIRQIIRGADAAIGEGIKWNAPSFRTTEYFATIHLRAKSGVGVVLHLGAAVRNIAGMPIEDPRGLLQWLTKDRAIVTFGDAADVLARGPAFERIVRQWIGHV
jgi:hypothetical protein